MTDYAFNICLGGLLGATMTFGITLGYALRHYLGYRKEEEVRLREGWEPLRQEES